MTAKCDPVLARRLVQWAAPCSHFEAKVPDPEEPSIGRQRQLLAEQLDAATQEIERLRKLASNEHAPKCAILFSAVPCDCGWHGEGEPTCEQLENERDRMRPVVKAAEQWHRWSAPRGLSVHRTSYTDALVDAVDAYRAAPK